MGNWKPWVYPGHWSVAEHNAVLAELRRAEAECGKWIAENNRLVNRETQMKCRIQDLEAALPQPAYARAHGARVELGALTQYWINRCREVESVFESEVSRLEAENTELRSKLEVPARPRLDVTPDVLRNHCITSNAEEFLAFLNSRIRYGVELPPELGCKCDDALGESCELCHPLGSGIPSTAAPTDAQIEAQIEELARKLFKEHMGRDLWTETGMTVKNVWLKIARAAYAHIGAELAAVTAERDQYKPYYDAVIDMAVVNWTLDGLSEKDVHYAIQKLIGQHIQEAVDPALNEELAKRDAQIAALTAERDQFDADRQEKDKVYLALLAEREDLLRQLAERTTRPVKVRFDVTAEEARRAWCNSGKQYGTGSYPLFFMDYLADHAVIDVPPGVPSVKELAVIAASAYGKQYKRETNWLELAECCQRDYCNMTAAILSTLAPYLRPPLVLPDREALAKALHEAYSDSYQDACIVKWGYLTESHLNARIAQADAALVMFCELNPEGGQG